MRLPFRKAVFDAIYGRGALLSYAPEASRVLAEAHRVLKRDGTIVLDAMNRMAKPQRRVTRAYTTVEGTPAYTEMFVRGDRQVLTVNLLRPTPEIRARARKGTVCERRPCGLARVVVSRRRYAARLFTVHEIQEILRRSGFRRIQIAPLGHLAYLQHSPDRRLGLFIRRNRDCLTELIASLSDHLRPETALHLLVTARAS